MGEDLPETFPEIDVTKWYCVHVNVYAPDDCGGNLLEATSCCKSGDQVKAWIDGNFDCVNNAYLCIVIGLGKTQRLMAILGPYDTKAACQLEC